LEQGTLIKNNVFGVGFKDGEKISLGCSVKGKVWSYLRGNLNELTEWCQKIGDVLENPAINPNTVLENTLVPVVIDERPDVTPIAIEWNHTMYEYAENRYVIAINGTNYDLSNSELNIIDSPDNEPLRFCFKCEEHIIEFDYILGSRLVDGESESFFQIRKTSIEEPMISYGNTTKSLTDFFEDQTPTIWFSNGGQLFRNNYVVPKERVEGISLDNIIAHDWTGVSINKEAQGVTPYETDSIQYHFIDYIRNDFQLIYDDDGSGEIADIIGINNGDKIIDIHLSRMMH
jgi:hypothetical protein